MPRDGGVWVNSRTEQATIVVNEDGTAVGSSSSSALQVTTSADTDGTDIEPVGRGSTSVALPSEPVDSTGATFGTDANPTYVVNKRASDASTDNMALGAAVDAPAATIYTNLGLDNVKAVVKASAGRFLYWHFDNTMNAAKTYIQVFNLLTADVTVGTTTPTFTLCVPASSVLTEPLPVGPDMSIGIVIAATTTATGSTAPATADLTATIFYK